MMEDGIVIEVHLQPRASANEIIGWKENHLYIRVTTPPVEGAANAACVNLLAKSLKLKKNQVSIVGGLKSREKRVKVLGISEEELHERIPKES